MMSVDVWEDIEAGKRVALVTARLDGWLYQMECRRFVESHRIVIDVTPTIHVWPLDDRGHYGVIALIGPSRAARRHAGPERRAFLAELAETYGTTVERLLTDDTYPTGGYEDQGTNAAPTMEPVPVWTAEGWDYRNRMLADRDALATGEDLRGYEDL